MNCTFVCSALIDVLSLTDVWLLFLALLQIALFSFISRVLLALAPSVCLSSPQLNLALSLFLLQIRLDNFLHHFQIFLVLSSLALVLVCARRLHQSPIDLLPSVSRLFYWFVHADCTTVSL